MALHHHRTCPGLHADGTNTLTRITDVKLQSPGQADGVSTPKPQKLSQLCPPTHSQGKPLPLETSR